MNKAKETYTSLSYSEPGDPWVTKWIIQLVEGLTGRNLIEKKYNEVLNRGLPGKDLMSAALRELDINLCFDGFSIMDIPREGPIIFIANHPFGVVDGLALGEIISKVRDKFEEHTSELQSHHDLVCRLLLEKKKYSKINSNNNNT